MRRGVACLLLILAARPAIADQAWGLEVDSEGRAFVVVDRGQKAWLWRVEPDGTRKVLEEGRFIRDVRLDKEGVPSIIRVGSGFDRGEFLTVGRRGPKVLLQSPADLPRQSFWGQFVMADDKTIYYGADRTIMAVRRGGTARLFAGGRPDGRVLQDNRVQLYAIHGMALGPDKMLYVADDYYVRRVDRDGSVKTLTNGLYRPELGDPAPTHPPSSRAMAVGDDGSIYVAIDGLGRIMKLKPDGKLSVAARFEEGWQPQGVALRGGRIYATELKWNVLKYEGPRLRVFEPDGTSRVIADLSPP